MSTEQVVFLTLMFLMFAGAGFVTYCKYRGEAKEEREAERAKQYANLRATENLAAKTTAVVLRRKDGGQTMLETLLIKDLIEYGANVVSLPREIAEEIGNGNFAMIPSGVICFVGAAWVADAHYHIDVRAVQSDGRFLTGCYACFGSAETAARATAREIGSTLAGFAKLEADGKS